MRGGGAQKSLLMGGNLIALTALYFGVAFARPVTFEETIPDGLPYKLKEDHYKLELVKAARKTVYVDAQYRANCPSSHARARIICPFALPLHRPPPDTEPEGRQLLPRPLVSSLSHPLVSSTLPLCPRLPKALCSRTPRLPTGFATTFHFAQARRLHSAHGGWHNADVSERETIRRSVPDGAAESSVPPDADFAAIVASPGCAVTSACPGGRVL